ncbi:hypothetical protein NMY22_g13611 [Coprinellus aureogranulatus]|nr:hypothetical protein NMY22_g13611 [Coprinellus aureogranulatus]
MQHARSASNRTGPCFATLSVSMSIVDRRLVEGLKASRNVKTEEEFELSRKAEPETATETQGKMEDICLNTTEQRVSALTLTSLLPPEILGEVFVQCTLHHPDAPLVLRGVSKVFRDVVDGTPGVWERLTLSLTKDTSPTIESKARWWLERSRSCPVDVRIELITQASRCSSGASTPLPSLSSPSLDNTNTNTNSASLYSTLAKHVNRIRTLISRLHPEPDARALLSSLYTSCDPTLSATQSLSIRISSTTPPNLRLSSFDARFPRLPKLRRLTLTNHTISILASADLGELRELEVVCPVRFQPIGVESVVGILRRTPVLEKLLVESRMVEESSQVSFGSVPVTPVSAFHQSPTPPSTSASSPTLSGNTPPPDDTTAPTLVHLPFLTNLSLRTNAIPPLLTHLLLPNLSSLHLEDLNGKRPHASKETATVLRQLLVRMELPTGSGIGSGTHGHAQSISGVGMGMGMGSGMAMGMGTGMAMGTQGYGEIEQQQQGGGEDATWGWCFKRMVSLEEVSVSKANVGPVLDILAPPLPSPSSSRSSSRSRAALLHHSPSSPSSSSFPSSRSSSTFPPSSRSSSVAPDRSFNPNPNLNPTPTSPLDIEPVCPNLRRCTLSSTRQHVPSALVDRFKAQRPSVEVVVELVNDPFYQSMATGPVDFLSLYSDSWRSEKGGVNGVKGGEKGGVKGEGKGRARERPFFGPWVLLA